jgi:hypothetical protein
VIVGVGKIGPEVTVKFWLDCTVPRPTIVTEILPVVANSGTLVAKLPSELGVKVAGVPLNLMADTKTPDSDKKTVTGVNLGPLWGKKVTVIGSPINEVVGSIDYSMLTVVVIFCVNGDTYESGRDLGSPGLAIWCQVWYGVEECTLPIAICGFWSIAFGMNFDCIE